MAKRRPDQVRHYANPPTHAAADSSMVPYVTGSKAKSFQFERAVVESAYREFYRQVDAQRTSGEPPVEAARDGIPDEWKKAHGLQLNEPNVANAVNADGYTMLEVYLNSLVTR